MNGKQKITLYITLAVVLISLILWIVSGMEFFTKTQILVEKKDELFGTTYKEWQNKFLWGLDLTLATSALSILLGGIFYYVFKNRKKIN